MKFLKKQKIPRKPLLFASCLFVAAAAVCLILCGGFRLWTLLHMEPGQLFHFSKSAVSSIELVDNRTGKATVIQDDETLDWIITALNEYRYSYVCFFDRERAEPDGGFTLRIHHNWQWKSYVFAGEGFLIDDLWYAGDTITLSSLSGLLNS